MTPSIQELSQPRKTCKQGHSYSAPLPQCPTCKAAWRQANMGILIESQRRSYAKHRSERIKGAIQWRRKNWNHWYQKEAERMSTPEQKQKLREARRKTSVRRIWAKMIYRCSNPKDPSYRLYGARGIRVCERWMAFECFAEDMGPRPSMRHSVERKNNNEGYCPDNCKWATYAEQARNTRRTHLLTFNGKTQCMADWALEMGITTSLLSMRINRQGWTTEKALTYRSSRNYDD